MSDAASVLLVGATGMVGSAAAACVPRLTVLVRRAPETPFAPGTTMIVAPTTDWADHIAAAAPAVFINCLGTTIAQAGSQAAFRAVDHDLVLASAQAAKAAGARQCISVSSVGASVRAGNFYLRTKGEVEAGLKALAFDRLDLLRPGLLTGARGGPTRLGESMAMLVAPFTDALLHGSLRRYRSVPGETVARAIAALVGAAGQGTFVHEHDTIVQLAD